MLFFEDGSECFAERDSLHSDGIDDEFNQLLYKCIQLKFPFLIYIYVTSLLTALMTSSILLDNDGAIRSSLEPDHVFDGLLAIGTAPSIQRASMFVDIIILTELTFIHFYISFSFFQLIPTFIDSSDHLDVSFPPTTLV